MNFRFTKLFVMESFQNLQKNLTKHIKGDIDRVEVALFYNNRGHARYMQVEFDQAIDDYNKAIEINPEFAIPYYNRGTVLYRLGHFIEAYDDMLKAVNLEPSNEEFGIGLDECRRKKAALECKEQKDS